MKQPTLRDKRLLLATNVQNSIKVDEQGRPLQDDDGEPIINVNVTNSFGLYEHCVQKFVTRVENYEGPNGPIATAQDLIDHGELEVLVEASAAILGEGDDTKTKKPSASTHPKTQASDGIAQSANAAGERSQGTETAATP